MGLHCGGALKRALKRALKHALKRALKSCLVLVFDLGLGARFRARSFALMAFTPSGLVTIPAVPLVYLRARLRARLRAPPQCKPTYRCHGAGHL